MADLGVWTKNADIIVRAGANANATAVTTAETDKYVLDIEAFINAMTRINWSDTYATLDADKKLILKDTGACLCACYVINYDMSGFSSLAEAQTMLNFLWARAEKNIGLLKEPACTDFVEQT